MVSEPQHDFNYLIKDCVGGFVEQPHALGAFRLAKALHTEVFFYLPGVRGQILYVWLGLEQTHALGAFRLAKALHTEVF
jgi:hypothetical protein